jgi:hypothetical protein
MADGDLTDDDMSTAAKREPEITVGGARPRRWLGYPWRLLRAVSFFCAGRWPPPADGGRQPVESILVLQANHIGDLLMTTPLLEVLRKGFPRARITVAAGAWNAETLAHNPHVDEFFTLPAPWDNAFVKPQSALARLRFLLFSREARELARRRFGVGIDAVGTRTNATMLIRIRPGPHRSGAAAPDRGATRPRGDPRAPGDRTDPSADLPHRRGARPRSGTLGGRRRAGSPPTIPRGHRPGEQPPLQVLVDGRLPRGDTDPPRAR